MSTDSPAATTDHDDRDDATVATDEALDRIGQRIRSARQPQLSVKALSELSGVSTGLISEIERGKGNPSFRTLESLARALGLQLGELIDQSPDAPIAGLVRRNERKRLATSPHGPIWELLSPNLDGRLELLETTLPAGFSNEDQPFSHVGEECIVVQSGTIEIYVDGVGHVLEPGDAITYDASLQHWYRNSHDGPAVVLGAVTPPTF